MIDEKLGISEYLPKSGFIAFDEQMCAQLAHDLAKYYDGKIDPYRDWYPLGASTAFASLAMSAYHRRSSRVSEARSAMSRWYRGRSGAAAWSRQRASPQARASAAFSP